MKRDKVPTEVVLGSCQVLHAWWQLLLNQDRKARYKGAHWQLHLKINLQINGFQNTVTHNGHQMASPWYI